MPNSIGRTGLRPGKPGRASPATSSKTKQLLETDVLVVGGGPAGIGTALGAARTGSRTLLIEAEGFFGGVAAWSLGMPINQMRPESKPRSVVHELLIEKLLAYGDRAVYVGQHQLYCNVDYLKVAILDALDQVGCKYLVHLSAVDTLTEGNRVIGVVVNTKQGLAAIGAKVIVDCTGDADVAYFAGAETMMETEDPRMPSTLLLGMSNVSHDQVRLANIRKIADAARDKYPLIPKSWGLKPVSNCRHYWINHTGTRYIGQFDMTDPFQSSQAECVSRRQALQITLAMREFGGEALKDVELVAISSRIEVRETRRVKGGYILNEEDASKSMGNCVATGHAAGLAAAISAKKGIIPRELKVIQLQDVLLKDGVDLTMGGKIQENVSGDRGV